MVPSHRLLYALTLLFVSACDGSNSSGLYEDFHTVRVKRLALSDAAGKTVVMLSASATPSGAPLIVVHDANGAVLKTMQIERSK